MDSAEALLGFCFVSFLTLIGFFLGSGKALAEFCQVSPKVLTSFCKCWAGVLPLLCQDSAIMWGLGTNLAKDLKLLCQVFADALQEYGQACLFCEGYA